MPPPYHTLVIGLGAMGSAACYHLARAGKRVLGIDRFAPPHTFGSSHGQTRIIREAYFEDPIYVPLVQRAYQNWAELEQRTGRRLFQQTGGLMIGPPDGVVFGGAKRSAEEHRLPHEILSAKDVKQRFPALQPEDGMAAVWEPRAGILFPEACIQAHMDAARELGAELALDETVLEWKPQANSVRVRTSSHTFEAERVIISAGAWARELVPELRPHLVVERQVLFWFAPRSRPELFEAARCPIHLWESAPGKFFYGFPDLGEGIKIARHHEGELTAPHAVNRTVREDEIETMRRDILQRFLPQADGAFRSATVCLYTNTPGGHFLIDRHPEHRNVLIASPCSGHGFKFASAIGEVLAGWALESPPQLDLSLFRFDRLARSRTGDRARVVQDR